MNEIFCFGDGYAANHIWPEWPAIISALYPNTKFQNFGAIGAGNEYITTSIVDAHKQNSDAFFIVQWAQHNRFDKLLQDASWDEIISNDPVYHFNVVANADKTWWLSSASEQDVIKEYHKMFVQPKQSETRTNVYTYLTEHLLDKKSIFFSTTMMESYSLQPRFATIRMNEVQPSPIVHMSFVEEYILPKMPEQPDANRIIALRNRIQNQSWEPYYYDRERVWDEIISSI